MKCFELFRYLILAISVSLSPWSAKSDGLVPWEHSESISLEELDRQYRDNRRDQITTEHLFDTDAKPDSADEEFEILGKRVVSETLVDESTERVGTSALLLSTIGNSPEAWNNYRHLVGIGGSVGLPRLSSALVGIPGTIRLSTIGEVFAKDSFLILDDRSTRQAITFLGGFTPVEWLEIYGGTKFFSVTNSLTDANLYQIQGDMTLGAKAARELLRGFFAGADLEISLFPRVGATGIGSLGIKPRMVSSVDFRDYWSKLLFLAHLEAGFILQTRPSLQNRDFSYVEEFALGINDYHRFHIGLGGEIPLPIAAPFILWRRTYHLGMIEIAEGFRKPSSGEPLEYEDLIPEVLTVGAKFSPLNNITLIAALDVRLNGLGIPGIPATQPWNIYLGAGFVVDPFGGDKEITRVIEKLVEVDRAVPPPPTTGRISGEVRDASSGEPLDSAIIWIESEESSPVASNQLGHFITQDIPPGTATLRIQRHGYRPISHSVPVVLGDISMVHVRLARAIEPSELRVSVSGAEKDGKSPIHAQVIIRGPNNRDLFTDNEGKLSTQLIPGDYVITVNADGYLTRQRNIEVEQNSRIILDLNLPTKSDESLVTMGDGILELERQIHFGTGSAVIDPDSYQIIDQVIDLIARHRIEHIRVEGHTDNEGPRSTNMRLSEDRANAVRDYLISAGISPHRIEAVGFGPDRPIASNLTQTGKAENRRVEFHIVGHSEAQ